MRKCFRELSEESIGICRQQSLGYWEEMRITGRRPTAPLLKPLLAPIVESSVPLYYKS